MQSKIEVEYKTLCTKQQFNQLLSLYPNHEKIVQTNTYLDAFPSLRESGMAMRIRQINDRYFFALKIKEVRGNEEIEFEIPSFSLDYPPIQNVLHTYHIPPVEPVGVLVTTRHLVKLENAELCMDINEYNGIIDYEVEYELLNPNHDTLDEFKEILKSANISYIPNKRSKIQRCLETRK